LLFLCFIYTDTENLLELTEDFDATVKPMKMSATDKSFLKEATESIHNNFATYNILNVSQMAHGSSSPLQNYFYRSLLPGEFCGTSLVLPESISGADQEDSGGGANALDIPTIAEDSISISSRTSGNMADNQSHSSLGISNTVDSSTYDAEAEEEKEPDDFYEDISELQDDYLAEKIKMEESKKQAPSESSSPRPSATSSSGSGTKGFSFFKSSKKESKDKKEKKKKSKKKEEKGKLGVPELPSSAPPPPQSAGAIKTESDSESYNEINPVDDSYLSDNYEDCSFNEMSGDQPPPLPLSLPPTISSSPSANSFASLAPPIPTSIPPAPPIPTSAPPAPTSMSPAPPLPTSMPPAPSLPASMPPAPPLPTSMPPPASSSFDLMKKKIMQRPPLTEKSTKEVPRISPAPSEVSLDGDYADADAVSFPEHVLAKKKEMKDQLSGGSVHSFLMETAPPPPLPNLASSANNMAAGELSLTSLRDQVVHLNGEVVSLKSEVRKLSEILEKLAPGSTGGSRKNTIEDNLRVLQAMSVNDVRCVN